MVSYGIMRSSHVLEFSLVGIHSLDLIDVIQLSRTSKVVWKVMRSLSEVYCSKAVKHNDLIAILNFFSEMKLLSINSTLFDWSLLHRIFCHPQILQLRLNSLGLINSSTDKSFLQTCSLIYDMGQLNLTGSRWSRIRDLEFHNCLCSGEAIEEIVYNCREVSRLALHGALFVSNSNITKIISNLEFLENLEFTSLLGIHQVILNSNLQRSLKILKITKCGFLRTISVNSMSIFQSLLLCDLSSTAVDSDCLDLLVSSSPLLEKLTVQECSSIYGNINFQSRSLKHINLQQTCNMIGLNIDCPKLDHLDIHGCLILKKLTVKSFCLRQLDLAMLTQLSDLEIDCKVITEIIFSGCKRLKNAKVLAISPFSESFSRKYYRDEFLRELDFTNDLSFIHFGNCELIQTVTPDNSKKNSLLPGHAKIRSSQFYRRSSSI